VHTRLTNHWAVVFAVGAACALPITCSVHDKTSYEPPPAPVDTTPPTRFAVDSGVVTLVGDTTETTPGIGDAGGSDGTGIIPGVADAGGGTSDGGYPQDSGTYVPPPRPGEPGWPCDVFFQGCGSLGCYPDANGLGTCQVAGKLFGDARCDPMGGLPETKCLPPMICLNSQCTPLCHYYVGWQPMYSQLDGTEIDDCAYNGGMCRPMGTSLKVGVCGR